MMRKIRQFLMRLRFAFGRRRFSIYIDRGKEGKFLGRLTGAPRHTGRTLFMAPVWGRYATPLAAYNDIIERLHTIGIDADGCAVYVEDAEGNPHQWIPAD